MKNSSKVALATFVSGVVVGMLFAPKKGSELRHDLALMFEDAYNKAKEIDIDEVKYKLEEIKEDIKSLDAEKSKEFVSEKTVVIKEKLLHLVDLLQENKKIKPALEDAIDRTEHAVIATINYIDEKELPEKAKETAFIVAEKSKDMAEKSKEVASKLVEDSKPYTEKAMDALNSSKEKLTTKFEELKKHEA